MATDNRESLAKAAEEVIHLIEVARKQAKIYPPHHPSVTEIVLELLQTIEGLLAARSVISINIAQKELFLDEIPLPDVSLTHSEFVELCVSKTISSLTFRTGLTGEEVTALVDLLNERLPEVGAVREASFRKKLAEKGVEHIEVGVLVSSADLDAAIGRGHGSREEQKARNTRDEALEIVWHTCQDLLAGRTIDYGNVELTVKGMVRGLLADRSVYKPLAAVKDYHNYTFNHMVNVAILSLLVGTELGLSTDQLDALGVAALLHDVGKLDIPVDLLSKPGKLTDDEWGTMRQHPVEGARVLLEQCGYENIGVTVALEHHARYDLSGYPKIAPNRTLHLFSRIVGVCDVYDALTSDRSYRRGIMPDKAAAIIMSGSSKDFDPALAKLFIQSAEVYPLDCVVVLTNGEPAVVHEQNPDDPVRPKVRLTRSGDEILDLRETDIGISRCIGTAAGTTNSQE